MSTVLDRNRLGSEASPYLRQHADNPVHWQPWDDDALDAAANTDRPIFLSIGYAACHWCHVMEEESFEDEAVAERLNEHFVPIKVDREERPDIDQIYQTICQLVSGRGGWPLSVWLFPDGRPFHVGTYFPRTASRGMPGFLDLLENIRTAWESDRDELADRADRWAEAIDEHFAPSAGAGDGPATDALIDAANAAVAAADRTHGGFGADGPKFPQPARLDALLRAYDRTDRAPYLDVVTTTLDAMANGGIFDHVGGGFHRYATDRTWTVPHFEKMLYDNAELSRIYLDAYRITGTDRYRDRVDRTLSFVRREMTHPEGGFYSTLDAQSEGAEGAFYVWSPDEIEEAIDDRTLADLFCDRYGVTAEGNFEGKTVLTVDTDIETLAASHDRSADAIRDMLDRARERVASVRADRPRPRRDEKILAGWNGLMISAAADAGLTLDDRHSTLADEALAFVRSTLWDPATGTLSRRYADGDVRFAGVLEDYAYLARGAFDLHRVTGERSPLQFALALTDSMRNRFWDPADGTLYDTAETEDPPVARPQQVTDQSTPSSLGVAADVFLTASHFDSAENYDEIVEQLLDTHGSRIEASPIEHATLAMVTDRFTAGPPELTIAAPSIPSAWTDRLGRAYLPGAVVGRRPPDSEGLSTWLDALDLPEAPPIWAGREAIDGRPTVYACRSFTCSRPLHSIDEAIEWLESGKDRSDPTVGSNV